jgi:hypothetical protein
MMTKASAVEECDATEVPRINPLLATKKNTKAKHTEITGPPTKKAGNRLPAL